jgi:hypothetical protein
MMRHHLSITALFAMCLFLAGCFQHTYTLGAGAPDGALVYKAWHHHWLFGLIRPEYQNEVLVSEVCPSGQATIHEETTFLNGLIDALIGIIYSPTTVTIKCEDGSKATLELDEEEVAEILHDPLFLEILAERLPLRLAEAREAQAGLPQPSSVLAMTTAR